MNSGYLALGGVLLLVGVLDLLWTTIWVEEGAGPLTSRLMASMWLATRRIARHEQRVLGVAGPVILLTSLTTWIALLWSGWTFIIASAEPGLINTLNLNTT